MQHKAALDRYHLRAPLLHVPIIALFRRQIRESREDAALCADAKPIFLPLNSGAALLSHRTSSVPLCLSDTYAPAGNPPGVRSAPQKAGSLSPISKTT